MTQWKSNQKYLMWDDGRGNAVITDASWNISKIYVRMADSLYNGGQPLNFFEVKLSGGSFTSENSKVKIICGFDNPHNPTVMLGEVHQHDGKIYRDGDSLCLVMNHPIIFHGCREVELPQELIVPLPEIRVKSYLFRNGLTFIYVSYNKYMTDYSDHKFFIGQPGDMQQVEILDLVRYRDGGTTIIKTKVGELFVPTPFKKGKPDYVIRFENDEFFECPDNLVVEENGSVAKVTNLV